MTLDQVEELVALPVEVRLQREAEERERRRITENWMTEKAALAKLSGIEDLERLAALDIRVSGQPSPDWSVRVSGGAFQERIALPPSANDFWAVFAVLDEDRVVWSVDGIDRRDTAGDRELPEAAWNKRWPVVVFAYLEFPMYSNWILNSHITQVAKDQRIKLL